MLLLNLIIFDEDGRIDKRRSKPAQFARHLHALASDELAFGTLGILFCSEDNNLPKILATASKVSLERSVKNQEGHTLGSSQIAFWYLMVVGNAT
jgi:hypothetical protein